MQPTFKKMKIVYRHWFAPGGLCPEVTCRECHKSPEKVIYLGGGSLNGSPFCEKCIQDALQMFWDDEK